MKLNYQQLLFLQDILGEQKLSELDKKSTIITKDILAQIAEELKEETQIKVDEQHEAEAEELRTNELNDTI